MKRIGMTLLSLMLALLMIPAGLSFAEEPETTEPAETAEVPDEYALLGTWIVVDGEGTDYDKTYRSQWNDGDMLIFCTDYRDGEMKLVMLDRMFTGNIFGYVTLEDGVISVPEVEKVLEEEYYQKYTFSYRFENAAECDPFVWEEKFASWKETGTDKLLYTPEMVKSYYEADPKDRLILHITGTKSLDSEEPKEVDTTLVFGKVLPMFFYMEDENNLNGTWKDASGYLVNFIWDEENGNKIELTDPNGIVYASNFPRPKHYAADGQILIGMNCYFENEADPTAGSLDYYIRNLTYDGTQLVITLDTGETIVLTPTAPVAEEPAA